MRVLHILHQLRASGAEVMLGTAAPLWIDEGLQLTALETSAKPGHYSGELERAGYTVHNLPLQRGPSDVWKLKEFFEQNHYDVVHIHPEGADIIPSLAARLANVPVVVRTVHHIFLYEGLLRRRKILERAFNRLLGTRYICNSHSGSENERARLHNPHRLAFNWFDDSHFRPPTHEQRIVARQALDVDDEMVFVSVGGCASYKNHDLILRALVETPDVRYLHAGPEPGDHERKLAAELGVTDRVRFLGVVPDVLQILYAADAYLMPSSLEGFGVAAVEALGAGVPAILSNRPALCDLRELVPARWVPVERSALASEMQIMAAKPREERRAEGLKASRVVREHFGVERGARRYLEVYRETL